MHQCDIAEDVGIAYGYNNIPKVFPPTNTTGKQIP
jgi:phenylalanyl-tRNA synthetase beta chain